MAAGHAWGTKVSVGGSLVPWSLEKNGVGTSGGLLSELVEGDDLTASFQDSLPSGFGDSHSGESHFPDVVESDVVGHFTAKRILKKYSRLAKKFARQKA